MKPNSSNAQGIWIVGIVIVLLVALACIGICHLQDNSLPAMDADQTAGGQQAAFMPPNCATCPAAPQCFPAGTPVAQQIAFNNNCMQAAAYNPCMQAAAYTPGCMQAAAFQNNQAVAPQTDWGQSQGMRQPQANNNTWGVSTVAAVGQTAPPPIFRDAVMPHRFRGVCENCHIVKPDIAIPASAQPAHAYRGVCSNCHTILGLNAGA